MSDSSTKLSITGKLTYSEEITVSQAAQIIAFLNASEGSALGLGGSLGTGERKGGTKKVASAREAIDVSRAYETPGEDRRPWGVPSFRTAVTHSRQKTSRLSFAGRARRFSVVISLGTSALRSHLGGLLKTTPANTTYDKVEASLMGIHLRRR